MDLDVVAHGGGAIVEIGLDFAEPRAQVLRQTSLVERARTSTTSVDVTTLARCWIRGRGAAKPRSTRSGARLTRFNQLDRDVVAVAERRVVNELRRLTARADVHQRDVLDEEERPGTELIDQPAHGRLDALDDIGATVRLAELRSEKVLRHVTALGSCSR